MRDGFAGLDACVHCGFCLQACPTFLATGDEADGPRGRIDLMRELERGTLSADDPALALHLDRCLGCRACETVCPSGVRYGAGLETARDRMRDQRAPTTRALTSALLATLTAPVISRAFYAGGRVIRDLGIAAALAGSGRLGFAFGMLAATKPANGRMGGWTARRSGPPTASPSTDPTIGPAQLFTGCVMSGLFSHVHRATVRTLGANGYGVTAPPAQSCCGALHAHAGYEGAAREMARANIAAFSGTEGPVVVNAAGCGAMLKEYGRLLHDDPGAAAFSARVKDVTEVLAQAGPKPGAPLELAVAYDPPCHLMHAQRVVDPPLQVLRAIPALRLVPLEDADKCCGSAGSFSLTQPWMSREVLKAKVESIRAARPSPQVVATGNAGCQMQIGAGLRAAGMRIPVHHPVELLDWSYGRLGVSC